MDHRILLWGKWLNPTHQRCTLTEFACGKKKTRLKSRFSWHFCAIEQCIYLAIKGCWLQSIIHLPCTLEGLPSHTLVGQAYFNLRNVILLFLFHYRNSYLINYRQSTHLDQLAWENQATKDNITIWTVQTITFKPNNLIPCILTSMWKLLGAGKNINKASVGHKVQKRSEKAKNMLSKCYRLVVGL